VSSGRAASSRDYLADSTIEHLPQADTFAGEERLRSILGVPLRAHGDILGVLFAAERTVRPFSDSEESLLAGLAAHAAAAIENARLLAAERSSTAELRATNERLEASTAAVQRAIVLHERLTEAVVRGGGPAEVVQALADVLASPVQLVDAFDRPLAGPELGAPSPRDRFESGERKTVVATQEEEGVVVLCPVVAADDYLGCLVVRGQGAADDADLRLLERGALGIALALVQQRALADAALRSRGELLTALVEGGESEILEQQAAAVRIDLTREHVLALMEPADPGARSACAELARRHDGLTVDRAGRTLLLIPADVDLEVLSPYGTTGLSPRVHGAAALPAAYAAARRSLQAALALGKRNMIATPESLGVYRFLLSASGPDEAAEFITRTIGPLLEHDESRGTDLARTLEEYLASGRQHSATAERLHIHPNTLYQRLTRIGAVLGEEWREPDTALDLHVALRLHRLAGQL
jgi:DNA-binding PucR family transcriptional regulator